MSGSSDETTVDGVTEVIDGRRTLDRETDAARLDEAMAGEEKPIYAIADDDYEFAQHVKRLRQDYDLVRVTVISVQKRWLRLVSRSAETVRSPPLQFAARHGYWVRNVGVEQFKYEDGSWFDHAYVGLRAYPSGLQANVIEFYEGEG